MATKSEVVESSFRLGSGRYIQEEVATLLLGDEVLRLGCKKPFILAGKTAWSLAEKKIKASLKEKDIPLNYYIYEGFCNPDHCDRILASEAFRGCDCLVGVGGGNLMDATKLCAAKANLPVINIPTSSATCAAYTPLSVMYNDKFQTIGSQHHLKEVNCILVDMDILCRQPVRLLVSGVYDSLAKLIETTQRLDGKTEEEIDIGLRSSFVLSDFIYKRLLADLPAACESVRRGENTKAIYDTVYLTICVTGIISALARGSNQCSIAHKIYESTRVIFPSESKTWLHGELVAIGLLAQLYYNGEEETAKVFRSQMRSVGMPVTLAEIGIPDTDKTMETYYNEVASTPMMDGVSAEELQKLRRSLEEMR